jgi:hypothetical protein
MSVLCNNRIKRWYIKRCSSAHITNIWWTCNAWRKRGKQPSDPVKRNKWTAQIALQEGNQESTVRKANILTATEGTKSNCQEGGKNIIFSTFPRCYQGKSMSRGQNNFLFDSLNISSLPKKYHTFK